MRTNTVLIRLIFIGILSIAGFILDPIGAHYSAPRDAAAAHEQKPAEGTARPAEANPQPNPAGTQTAAPRQAIKLLGLPSPLLSAILGLLLAVVMIAFEMRIQQASLKTLIGAGIGSMMG